MVVRACRLLVTVRQARSYLKSANHDLVRSLRCLRDGLAPRDSSKSCSGLSEPTRLVAVRVATPKTAPASARDRNQNCFNWDDGRVETSHLGKRGPSKASTYCSGYCRQGKIATRLWRCRPHGVPKGNPRTCHGLAHSGHSIG